MNNEYGALHYLTGGFAGVCVDITLFPLDTIKTRIQAQIKGQSLNVNKVSSYSGLKSQVIASFPSAAAFFSSYDLTKYFMLQNTKIDKNFIHILSAIVGEASAVFVRNPFELIKQNMQIGRYNSLSSAFLHIFQERGIRGLYKGYFITVLREIPFGIIQYPLYEHFKHKKGTNATHLDFGLAGAYAGAISAFVTTPLDVIKTRVMTSKEHSAMDKIKNVIHQTKKNEGFLGFFKGAPIRVLYISIGGMMFFGSNEFIKKQLSFY